ncbi:MAG: hypothetical protein IKJ94_05005 [Oscillospiraceae bacterium]|nr:hypothetical protein [Oscillospiraceae bacterium]
MEQELDVGLEQMKLQAVDAEKELLVLRLALGKLRAVAEKAFAPVTAPLLEGLQRAVFWATRLVKNIGIVLSALTGLRAGQEGYTKAVTKTVKALRRELAGFDELNRLGTPKSGVVTTQIAVDPEAFAVPEHLQRIIDGIHAALEPLQQVDLAPLKWHFYRLSEAVQVLWDTVKPGLSFVWYQMLMPFAQWITEQLVPTALFCLQRAVEAVTAVLKPFGEGFGLVWEAMQPVFRFVGDNLLYVLDQLRRCFGEVTRVFTEKAPVLSEAFVNIRDTVTQVWNAIMPTLETLRQKFLQAFGDIRAGAGESLGYFIEAFCGLTQFLKGVFSGDWSSAWEGLKRLVKNALNGILSMLNGLLSGLAGGLNAMISMLNKLSFKIPDWVPGMGGKSFGLSLPRVKAMQIPLLAQGAVLPANKPFLAVVGDQKHGTNIEAPLATIQQAVAQVMGDTVPAMMAGFEALLQENIALRHTVEGLSLDTDTLFGAVDSYKRKMSLMRGV